MTRTKYVAISFLVFLGFSVLFILLIDLSFFSESFAKQKNFLGRESYLPSTSSTQAELFELAKSQIWPWKNAKLNFSDIREFCERNEYLYVVEIKNSKISVPSYVDRKHSHVNNIKQFLSTLEEILNEVNDIMDTVLLINLLDEPRLSDRPHCRSSGLLEQVEAFHGFPTSYIKEIPDDLALFPVMSHAVIPGCFNDILIPFDELLNAVYLQSLRRSQHKVCQWSVQDRLKTAFFRGSLTGHSVKEGRNHRLKVARMCDNNESRVLREFLTRKNYKNLTGKFGDGPLCDVAFNEAFESYKYADDLTSPSYFIPMEVWEQLTYFVLDMDGNSYSRRLATLCFLDANVIRVGIFDDVLLHLLQHDIHYLHVEPDMSDLFDSIRRLRNDWNYSQSMCANKFVRCQNILNYDNMKYYVKSLLSLYSKNIHFV
eukprot:jgi/Galph1/5881/GphlegSOOS_G4420.1